MFLSAESRKFESILKKTATEASTTGVLYSYNTLRRGLAALPIPLDGGNARA